MPNLHMGRTKLACFPRILKLHSNCYLLTHLSCPSSALLCLSVNVACLPFCCSPSNYEIVNWRLRSLAEWSRRGDLAPWGVFYKGASSSSNAGNTVLGLATTSCPSWSLRSFFWMGIDTYLPYASLLTSHENPCTFVYIGFVFIKHPFFLANCYFVCLFTDL